SPRDLVRGGRSSGSRGSGGSGSSGGGSGRGPGGGRSGGGGKGPPSRLRRWMKRILIWGSAFALLCVIALGTAVYFAASNLPSYSELRDSKAGQTIVLRARDGSEIVSMGPSYGQWLSYDEIPEVMKDAMI